MTEENLSKHQVRELVQEEKLSASRFLKSISDRLSFGQDEHRQLIARVQDIPAANLQPPPAITVAKVIEGFNLSEDAPNLRQMYINLLAASMDSEKADLVRAGFAETIQQLNPDEAKILTLFSDKPALPIVDVVQVSSNKDGQIPLLLNFSLVGKEAECRSPQHTPLYLDKLQRLGLVTKNTFTVGVQGYGKQIDFEAMFKPLTEDCQVELLFGLDAGFHKKSEELYQKQQNEMAKTKQQFPNVIQSGYADSLEEYISWLKEARKSGDDPFRLFEKVAPTIRKSVIMLTVFGRTFCHHCLPFMDKNQDDPRLASVWHPNANLEDVAESLAKKVSAAAVKNYEEEFTRSLQRGLRR